MSLFQMHKQNVLVHHGNSKRNGDQLHELYFLMIFFRL